MQKKEQIFDFPDLKADVSGFDVRLLTDKQLYNKRKAVKSLLDKLSNRLGTLDNEAKARGTKVDLWTVTNVQSVCGDAEWAKNNGHTYVKEYDRITYNK